MSQNKYSSSVDAIIEGLRRRQEEAPAQDESQVDDILASLGVVAMTAAFTFWVLAI